MRVPPHEAASGREDAFSSAKARRGAASARVFRHKAANVSEEASTEDATLYDESAAREGWVRASVGVVWMGTRHCVRGVGTCRHYCVCVETMRVPRSRRNAPCVSAARDAGELARRLFTRLGSAVTVNKRS